MTGPAVPAHFALMNPVLAEDHPYPELVEVIRLLGEEYYDDNAFIEQTRTMAKAFDQTKTLLEKKVIYEEYAAYLLESGLSNLSFVNFDDIAQTANKMYGNINSENIFDFSGLQQVYLTDMQRIIMIVRYIKDMKRDVTGKETLLTLFMTLFSLYQIIKNQSDALIERTEKTLNRTSKKNKKEREVYIKLLESVKENPHYRGDYLFDSFNLIKKIMERLGFSDQVDIIEMAVSHITVLVNGDESGIALDHEISDKEVSLYKNIREITAFTWNNKRFDARIREALDLMFVRQRNFLAAEDKFKQEAGEAVLFFSANPNVKDVLFFRAKIMIAYSKFGVLLEQFHSQTINVLKIIRQIKQEASDQEKIKKITEAASKVTIAPPLSAPKTSSESLSMTQVVMPPDVKPVESTVPELSPKLASPQIAPASLPAAPLETTMQPSVIHEKSAEPENSGTLIVSSEQEDVEADMSRMEGASSGVAYVPSFKAAKKALPIQATLPGTGKPLIAKRVASDILEMVFNRTKLITIEALTPLIEGLGGKMLRTSRGHYRVMLNNEYRRLAFGDGGDAQQAQGTIAGAHKSGGRAGTKPWVAPAVQRILETLSFDRGFFERVLNQPTKQPS